MEAFAIRHLSFTYPENESSALSGLSLTIRQGEFITVCGASGSGKTTLLRLLKPSISPHGRLKGSIDFLGHPLTELSHRDECAKIGYVQQSPDNQLVTDKVWHELAFGLESLGLSQNTIRRRVAETASFFGIQPYFESDVANLSGGQKQLVNLASVMAMQPQVLILDEPTSQLDPIAASEFISCIHRINRELGVTVILSEHRLEEVLPLSDRVMVLDSGQLISFDTPSNTGGNLKRLNNRLFDAIPSPMRIWYEVNDSTSACPVTVSEGRAWLQQYTHTHQTVPLYPEEIPKSGETVLELKNTWFRYQKDSDDVLRGVSLDVHQSEFIAVLGGNGAGKSTLLSVMNGLKRSYNGKVKSSAQRIATLPQNPQLILSGNTVLASLREMFEGSPIPKEQQETQLQRVIALCHLENLLSRHPFDLSGGETQRAALAKLLLSEPDLLLLDEPTKGLDEAFKEQFAQIIRQLTDIGTAVVMVSHDVEFCAQYPHRCMMLFNGELVAEGTPREFFSENSFYVTSAGRMAKDLLPDVVTANDVIFCCTGRKMKQPTHKPDDFHFSEHREQPIYQKTKLSAGKMLSAIFGALTLLFGILVNTEIIPVSLPFWANAVLIIAPLTVLMISLSSVSKKTMVYTKHSKLPKRTIAATAIILLTIPLTIFVGTVYLYDQKYLFISLLVLLECMLPFFLIFEGRKPQARELVIIAVMCAIAVAGRSVFMALPQMKPVIALVIIAGVALGAESGFMVGAVTMLVSNIYFGQGAWTPWQMFAAGIIGYLAGLLFQKGLLSRSRGALCVFGFIVTVMIYGLIMNFSTLILSRTPINSATLLAFYAQGLPFDIVHAISTLVVLFFAAEPMLFKLDRVKTKYGLL